MALQFLALGMVGFVIARVVLRQGNDLMAMAQGLAIGVAIWGLTANLVMFLLPGLAGAIVAWAITLGIGAKVAWRAAASLRVPLRTTALFGAAALATFWLALAGRQLLSIADDEIHHGLASSIRAGGFPPVLPWNPGQPAPYHYGIDMLVGLLAPPAGPDLAFVNELLAAYIWTSLALIVGTGIFKLGGWVSALALCPLILTAGAWTLYGSPNPPSILQFPVPTGTPETGLRTALSEVYWPSFDLPLDTNFDASPPNSWRPSFPLAYLLTFIVLERVAVGRERTLTSACTLAAVLGFVGLVDESVALIGLALWIAFELSQILKSFHLRKRLQTASVSGNPDQLNYGRWPDILRVAAGPALTVVLLVASGGVVTGLVTGSSHSGLSLVWHENPSSRRPLGDLTVESGGVGMLGLGPAAVALVAVLLAWRNPFVLLLAVGSSAFLLAALALFYEPFPGDITRMDGHARNFALIAVLLALAIRLAALRTRYRYVAAAGIIALATWPTAASPARALSLGIERGIQLSNMPPGPREFHQWFQGRHAVKHFSSDAIADFIRTHTPADARVLSPYPDELTIATGRPNASGFAHHLHIIVGRGPEYKDAIRFLEPAAIRQLGIDYVHTTEAWKAELPAHAQQWLANPELFELLIRSRADALYRVHPAFLSLRTSPAQGSFEALRQAVPPSTSVYLSPDLEPQDLLRVAAALPQAQLLGKLQPSALHLFTDLESAPLGTSKPDVIVTSTYLAPSAFDPSARQPVWWNDTIAVYAPTDAIKPVMDPPAPHVSLRMSEVRMVDSRIAFTATFTDRSSDRWTGQDWVVIPASDSRWAIPDRPASARRYQAPARSFTGQLQPVAETDIHEYLYLYQFEPRTATLAQWDGSGYATLEYLGRDYEPGIWLLAMRLLHRQHEAALIPVLRVELTESNDYTYIAYQGSIDAMLVPVAQAP